jgi:predicted secreted protein
MWQGRCTNLTNTHHCHMMGVYQVCTSTLSQDGRLSSLYIYLVTWWVFVKFVHLPCHMMGVCQVCTSTLSHDGCLSSLYIYLVTWWMFVMFVHLPCHMMVVCQVCNLPWRMMGVSQVCTSTLSHDGCLSSSFMVDVQTWQTPIMWQGRCTNLTNTHHMTR